MRFNYSVFYKIASNTANKNTINNMREYLTVIITELQITLFVINMVYTCFHVTCHDNPIAYQLMTFSYYFNLNFLIVFDQKHNFLIIVMFSISGIIIIWFMIVVISILINIHHYWINLDLIINMFKLMNAYYPILSFIIGSWLMTILQYAIAYESNSSVAYAFVPICIILYAMNFVITFISYKFLNHYLVDRAGHGIANKVDYYVALLYKNIILITIVAYSPTLQQLFLMILIPLYTLIRLFILYKSPPYYSQYTMKILMIFCSLKLNIIVAYFLTILITDIIGIYHESSVVFTWIFITMIPITMKASLIFFKWKYDITTLMDNTKTFNENQHIYKVIKRLLLLKEGYGSTYMTRKIKKNELLVEAIIKNHFKFCEKCEFEEELIPELCQRTTSTYDLICLHIIEKDLDIAMEKFPNSFTLQTLMIIFYLQEKNQFYKPIISLGKLNRCNLSIDERLTFEILKDKLLKLIYTKNLDSNLKINKMLEMDEIYENFLIRLTQHAQQNLAFWKELNMKYPCLETLLTISNDLEVDFQKIKTIWGNFEDKCHKNFFLKPLLAYVNFLLVIKNRLYEASQILNTYHLYKHKFKSIDIPNTLNENNLFSDNNIMIAISGQLDRLGQIISCSKSIEHILEFKVEELVNYEFIEFLMPEFYRPIHKDFILKFFKTEHSYALNHTRNMFFSHKEGHIVPVLLHVKLLPDINYKFGFIGICRPSEQIQQYILLNIAGDILGMTKELANMLNYDLKDQSKRKSIFQFCEDFKEINQAFNQVKQYMISPHTNSVLPIEGSISKKSTDLILNPQFLSKNLTSQITTPFIFTNYFSFTDPLKNQRGSLLSTRRPRFSIRPELPDEIAKDIYNRYSTYGDMLIFQQMGGPPNTINSNSRSISTMEYKYKAKISDAVYLKGHILRQIILESDSNPSSLVTSPKEKNINHSTTAPTPLYHPYRYHQHFDAKDSLKFRTQKLKDKIIETSEEASRHSSSHKSLNLEQIFVSSGEMVNNSHKQNESCLVEEDVTDSIGCNLVYSSYISPKDLSKYDLVPSSTDRLFNANRFESKREDNPFRLDFLSPHQNPGKIPQKKNIFKKHSLVYIPAKRQEQDIIAGESDINVEKKFIKHKKSKEIQGTKTKSSSETNIPTQVYKLIDAALDLQINPRSLVILILLIFAFITCSFIIMIIFEFYRTTLVQNISESVSIVYNSNQRMINMLELYRRMRYIWCIENGLVNESDDNQVENLLKHNLEKAIESSYYMRLNNTWLLETSSKLDTEFHQVFFDNLIKLNNPEAASSILTSTSTSSFAADFSSSSSITRSIMLSQFAAVFEIDYAAMKFCNEYLVMKRLNYDGLLNFLLDNILNDLLLNLETTMNYLQNDVYANLDILKFAAVNICIAVGSVSLVLFILIIGILLQLYQTQTLILSGLMKVHEAYNDKQLSRIQRFISITSKKTFSEISIRESQSALMTRTNNAKQDAIRNHSKTPNLRRMRLRYLTYILKYLLIIIICMSVFLSSLLQKENSEGSISNDIGRIFSTYRFIYLQSLAVNLVMDYIAANGTTLFKNDPIDWNINNTLHDVSSTSQLFFKIMNFQGDHSQIEYLLSKNICALLASNQTTSCEAYGSGIATEGILSLNLYTYKSISNAYAIFYSSKRTLNDSQKALESIKDINDGFYNINLMIYDYLSNVLNDELHQRFIDDNSIEIIWITVTISILILIVFLLWKPTRKKLLRELYVTKKTIQLMPKSFILANTLLKHYIIQISKGALLSIEKVLEY